MWLYRTQNVLRLRRLFHGVGLSSYVVPVNVLEHFLEDVSRHGGKYLGFPRMGITQQRLESPALRESLRMSAAQTGTMITSVEVRLFCIFFFVLRCCAAIKRHMME